MRWAVRPGRRLHWAPPWTEGDTALVFDAASGDYWVLSSAASELLRAVASGMSASDAPPVQSPESPESPRQDAALMAELGRHGLVVPAV